MIAEHEQNPAWGNLLLCQKRALEHIRQLADANAAARARINDVLEKAGVSEGVYDNAITDLRSHACTALHFHPERLSRGRETVAAGLLKSGIYKNQFETGLSSGSPSAFPGGERDQWENRLFGGAYHGADVAFEVRPKYGALQLIAHADGPAPRFGSCYFLLQPMVSERSSFTFGSSHELHAVEQTATLDRLDPVMASLLTQLERGQGAFGLDSLTVPGLLAQLTRELSKPIQHPITRPLGRALDSFIEVQVHGEIRLDRDVQCLVADPVFRGDVTGESLTKISVKYNIPLHWHPGFTLSVDQVPGMFRDYPVRPLAERIAGKGILNAANIGAMANTLTLDPEAWRDWASYDDTLTQFRRLWHVLVLNGMPGEPLEQ